MSLEFFHMPSYFQWNSAWILFKPMAFSLMRLSKFILKIEERNRSGHLNACGIHVENIWPYAIIQQKQLLVSHKFNIPNPTMIRSSLFEHITNAMTHRQFFLSLHISSEQFIWRMRRRCCFFYFISFLLYCLVYWSFVRFGMRLAPTFSTFFRIFRSTEMFLKIPV